MDLQIIPTLVMYDDVARLRITTEQGSDPVLYEIVARGFDALDMPAAAEAMQRKADHYRSLNDGTR